MFDVEERNIVELNLDFPSVFSKVGAGEGSRRFGRSKSILETNQGTDVTDGGQYLDSIFLWGVVDPPPPSFIFFVLALSLFTLTPENVPI